MFISNNHTSFPLWGKQNLVKHQKVSKYCENDCGLQSITIHILPNNSKSEGNQTMTYGRLIEYNQEKYFYSKIMQKMREAD